MSTDLARLPNEHELEQYRSLTDVIVKSGLFRDTTSQMQAAVKALAGRELGLGPFAAQNAFDIIDGKLSMSANIIGSRIKAHPRYDYRVVELTRKGCSIDFYENGQPIGRFTFDDDDRKAAGLEATGKNRDGKVFTTPWGHHPKAMFFARAISQGARVYCPDIFYGVTAYTPGELGDEEVPPDLTVSPGEYGGPAGPVVEPDVSSPARAPGDLEPDPHIIEGEVLEHDSDAGMVSEETSEPRQIAGHETPASDHQADVEKVVRETGRDLARAERKATKAQLAKLAILADEIGWNDDERHYHAGVDSFTELSRDAASALIETWQELLESSRADDVAPEVPLGDGSETGVLGGSSESSVQGEAETGAEVEAGGLDETSAPTVPPDADEPATPEQFTRALVLAQRLGGMKPDARVKRELSFVHGGAIGDKEFAAATKGEMAQVIEGLMEGGRAGR